MMGQDEDNKIIEMEDLNEGNTDVCVDSEMEDECPKCNEVFSDFEALIDHCSAIHYLKVDIEKEGVMTLREICESCEEMFSDYDALIEHSNSTHNNNNVIIHSDREKIQPLELDDQLDSMKTVSDGKNTNAIKNANNDLEESNDLDSIYLGNANEPSMSKKRKYTDEKGNVSKILRTDFTKEFEYEKKDQFKQMNEDLPYEVIDLDDDDIGNIIKEKINSNNKNEKSVDSQHSRKVTVSVEVLTNVIQANNLLKLVQNNNLSLSTVPNDEGKSRTLDNDDSDDDSIIFIENEDIADSINLKNSEVCFDEAFKKYFLIEMCLEEDEELEKLESSWENIRDSIWEEVYPTELNEVYHEDMFNTPPSSPEMITDDESPEIITDDDSFKSEISDELEFLFEEWMTDLEE